MNVTNEFYVVNTTHPNNPAAYNDALGTVVATSMNILPQGNAKVAVTYTASRRRLWYGGNESLYATYVQTVALVPVLQVPSVVPCLPNAAGKTACGRKDLDAVSAYVTDRLITAILSKQATALFRAELTQRASNYFKDIEIVLELPVQEAQILSASAVTAKGFDWMMILYALLGLLLLCCCSVTLFRCKSMGREEDEEEDVDIDHFRHEDDPSPFGKAAEATAESEPNLLGHGSIRASSSSGGGGPDHYNDANDSGDGDGKSGKDNVVDAYSRLIRGWKTSPPLPPPPPSPPQSISLRPMTKEEREANGFGYGGLSATSQGSGRDVDVTLYPTLSPTTTRQSGFFGRGANSGANTDMYSRNGMRSVSPKSSGGGDENDAGGYGDLYGDEPSNDNRFGSMDSGDGAAEPKVFQLTLYFVTETRFFADGVYSRSHNTRKRFRHHQHKI